MNNTWEGILSPPLPGRKQKPRTTGITMLIDKGLTIRETGDLLSLNDPYLDFIKLTFGTAALYPKAVLIEKIKLVKSFGVFIYPGGTFFELALSQGKRTAYFQSLIEVGFDWVEISDGTLDISGAERTLAIQEANKLGLHVITEVGKKDAANQPNEDLLAELARRDLQEGAEWVIMEGRESGKGIGIYDNQGGLVLDKFNRFSNRIEPEKIIWEAPLKGQQAVLINHFGPNVNLGNIPPSEIMALEALRLGYRSDTWKKSNK